MMLPTNILPGNNFYEVYKCYCKQAQDMYHSDVLYDRLVEYFKSNHITALDTNNSTIAINIVTHDLSKCDNEKTDIQLLNHVLTKYPTLTCENKVQTSDEPLYINSTPFNNYSLHSVARLLDTAIIRETNIHQFVISFIADTVVIFTYMNFMRVRRHIKSLVSACALENRIKELMKIESQVQDTTEGDKNEKIKELEQANDTLKRTNTALEKKLENIKDISAENIKLKNDVNTLQARVAELEKSNTELKQDNEYYATLVPAVTKKEQQQQRAKRSHNNT
jgi:hypothetical protein